MLKFLHKLLGRKKYYCMLPANKLTELKNISIDLKHEIQQHHNEDPGNVDDYINGQLLWILQSALFVIEQIEKKNNVEL